MVHHASAEITKYCLQSPSSWHRQPLNLFSHRMSAVWRWLHLQYFSHGVLFITHGPVRPKQNTPPKKEGLSPGFENIYIRLNTPDLWEWCERDDFQNARFAQWETRCRRRMSRFNETGNRTSVTQQQLHKQEELKQTILLERSRPPRRIARKPKVSPIRKQALSYRTSPAIKAVYTTLDTSNHVSIFKVAIIFFQKIQYR